MPGRSAARLTNAGCSCGGGCPGCRGPTATPLPGHAARGAAGDAQEQEAERFALRFGAGTPRGAPADAHESPAARRPLHSGGAAMAQSLRAPFEQALGADLSAVRVHADAEGAASARAERAHAYTHGEHVVFSAGRFRPDTNDGRNLLAHELAHTLQQGAVPARPLPARPAPQGASAAPPVARRSRRQTQGSFWDDLWGGVQAVGNAIGDAAQWVGEAVGTAASWMGERVRDVAQWVVSLVSELPARLFRLGQTLLEGFAGVVSFIPDAITALANGGAGGLADFLWERLKSGGTWALTMLSRLFDVMGGPEALEFVTHMATRATPLTSSERAAGAAVLGETAMRWDQVRIAEGGVLHAVFALNGGRAVTTWHTINMPVGGAHGRSNLDIVVHELTHVMQYERVGTLYMGQAIHAQMTVGYSYGGAAGLRTATAAGQHYADFNREQQAQIAQDYHSQFVATGTFTGADHDAYAPFIAELRAGQI
ncbi:DUF4157 domain-containing protein [Roseateles sp.]|uniref:eCIS core domain-containing protein n=1 Tax=Roseateles sp. TaxID=1971397 RepID=UPI0032674E77